MSDEREDEVKLIEKGVKWSWSRFFVGKLGNKFIAWIVTTVITFTLVHNATSLSDKNAFVILIIWGIATIVFMLAGAIDVAVNNAKINADFKVGVGK